MNSIVIFLISFLIVYLLTPLFRKIALRLDVIDYPDHQRKLHTEPMPLLGGLSICVGFFVILISVVGFGDSMIRGFILGSLIILIMGLVDDKRNLSARLRLLIQLFAALIVIKSGIVLTFLPNTFWGIFGEWVLSIVWIIGITNALNCLDGLDGLATGLSFIICVCFYIICLQTQQLLLGIICLALAGSCLGFLRYNFRPATIFLGNSGSTFLGFILACIGIMGNWAEDNLVAITVPILILGVPIFDMTFTTIMRLRNRKIKDIVSWLEYGALDHFHHRLVDLGLHFRGAVLFICFISLVLGLSAIVLWDASGFDALVLLIQAGIIFVAISVLMVIGKRRRSGWHLENKNTNKH